MKKAKVMLTVIAVFAVVGAALAFKAQKFADKNVYCKLSASNCPIQDYKTTFESNPLWARTTQPCTNPATGLKITTYYTEPNCITVNNGTVFTTTEQ